MVNLKFQKAKNPTPKFPENPKFQKSKTVQFCEAYQEEISGEVLKKIYNDLREEWGLKILRPYSSMLTKTKKNG